MRVHTERLVAYLEASHAEFETALAQVPVARQRERPGADRWSAAEVVEHLGLVERNITVLVTRLISKTPRLVDGSVGPEVDVDAVAGGFDGVVARATRVEAPDTARPTGDVDMDTAWATLDARRQQLLETVRRADGRDLSGVEVPHPRLGPLNLYQWVVFVGAHERRHTRQVQEIADTVA